ADSHVDRRCARPTASPSPAAQHKLALLAGVSIEDSSRASCIDPWFLVQLQELLDAERWVAGIAPEEVGAPEWRRMKRMGFSDTQLGALRNLSEAAVRETRWRLGIHPAYKTVDTCAGEFPSATPYLYSSYDTENESEPFGPQVVLILGCGPK